MSKDSVKNFYEFLKQDASAVEELKKASECVDTAEKATEAVIAFAAEKGFDFDEKDIAAYEECVQKELSLDELEKVNAGVGGFCLILGFGDGNAVGGGEITCKVIGIGVGVGWRDRTQEEKDRLAEHQKTNPHYCDLLAD